MKILERFEDGIVALLEIGKLHDHEQINEEALAELTAEIEKDGQLKYPIIVDKYSYVVLDGHHRYFALKNIGCRYVPAYVVDYYDSEITVHRWYPIFRKKSEVDVVFKVLEENNFKIVQVGNLEILNVVVDAGQAICGIAVANETETFYIVQKTESSYSEIISLLRTELGGGKKKPLEHKSGPEAMELLQQGKALMELVSPHLTKEQIVEVGIKGDVFPPKTTRHVLPDKKYYPVPLSMLKEH